MASTFTVTTRPWARSTPAMPPAWSRANPADIVGDADPARFAAALGPILEDPNVDAAMVIHCPTAVSHGDDVAQAVSDVVQKHRSAAYRAKRRQAEGPGHQQQVERQVHPIGDPHGPRAGAGPREALQPEAGRGADRIGP